jgi:hypothetical protein
MAQKDFTNKLIFGDNLTVFLFYRHPRHSEQSEESNAKCGLNI